MTSGSPATPYDLVARHEAVRPVTKQQLVVLCRDLEREALADPPEAAAATLQDVRHLTGATRAAYAALAATGTPVTMFARGLPAWLAPGVRGVALDDEDPLGDVWSVVLLGPRPVALAALDLFAEGTTDAERPFQLAVSRDPGVVAAAAQALGLLAVSGPPRPGTPGP